MSHTNTGSQAGFHGMVNWLWLALRHWQDWCYLTSLLNRLLRATGQQPSCSDTFALQNYLKFPDFLRQVRNLDSQQVQNNFMAQFRPPTELPKANQLYWARFALALLRWQQQPSQRIYVLDTQLQALLATSSLENVRWKDVRFPEGIDCLVLQLAQSYINSSGHAFHTIIVEGNVQPTPEHIPLLSLRFIGGPPGAPVYTPISSEEKARIEGLIAFKAWHQAGQAQQTLQERLNALGFTDSVFHRTARSSSPRPPGNRCKLKADRWIRRRRKLGTR